MVTAPGADRYPAYSGGRPRGQLDRVDAEAAGCRGRAREQALHGVGQAAGDARRAGHGERCGAAGELAVEDEERQAAEVIAVQVRNEDGGDLARVESEAFQSAERGSAAV